MVLLKQKRWTPSLLYWCFNRESKTYLYTSDKAGFLSNEINVGLALSYVKLSLSSWKTYMCHLRDCLARLRKQTKWYCFVVCYCKRNFTLFLKSFTRNRLVNFLGSKHSDNCSDPILYFNQNYAIAFQEYLTK